MEMYFKLLEEYEMIRKMVWDFVKNEVVLIVVECDEEEWFDWELFD